MSSELRATEEPVEHRMWDVYEQPDKMGEVLAPIRHNWLYGTTRQDLDEVFDKWEETKPGYFQGFVEAQIKLIAPIGLSVEEMGNTVIPDNTAYVQNIGSVSLNISSPAFFAWMANSGELVQTFWEKTLTEESRANYEVQKWYLMTCVFPLLNGFYKGMSKLSPMIVIAYLAVHGLINGFDVKFAWFFGVAFANTEVYSYLHEIYMQGMPIFGSSIMTYGVLGAVLARVYKRGLFAGKGLWQYLPAAVLAYGAFETYAGRHLHSTSLCAHAEGAAAGFAAYLWLY